MSDYEIDICVQDNRWAELSDLQGLSERAIAGAMTQCQPKPFSELSLAFVSDIQMQSLNQQYRNIDAPTNVLSFPAQNGPTQNGSANHSAEFSPLLGDIVFAFDTITAQASAQEILIKNHLSHLIVHGFLHLQGYDHEDPKDADIMESLETQILADLGISDPYANERIL
ncbi:MAG: rRNA maturation RNase YbeY [Robiginitomaculum sp.]|nr:rRNA maturation RNase YbeY [Robiginitomaculum sp.]